MLLVPLLLLPVTPLAARVLAQPFPKEMLMAVPPTSITRPEVRTGDGAGAVPAALIAEDATGAAAARCALLDSSRG